MRDIQDTLESDLRNVLEMSELNSVRKSGASRCGG